MASVPSPGKRVTRYRLKQNAVQRWIILHPALDSLAWSGLRWASVDERGLPSGDVQVSNFYTKNDAAHFADGISERLLTATHDRVIEYAEKVFESREKAVNWLDVWTTRLRYNSPSRLLDNEEDLKTIEALLIYFDKGRFPAWF